MGWSCVDKSVDKLDPKEGSICGPGWDRPVPRRARRGPPIGPYWGPGGEQALKHGPIPMATMPTEAFGRESRLATLGHRCDELPGELDGFTGVGQSDVHPLA